MCIFMFFRFTFSGNILFHPLPFHAAVPATKTGFCLLWTTSVCAVCDFDTVTVLLIGSHGDGQPANTDTPLVAWGAGIQNPRLLVHSSHSDDGVRFVDQHKHDMPTPTEWGLSSVERVDVNQADIAPLMVFFPLSLQQFNCVYESKSCCYSLFLLIYFC